MSHIGACILTALIALIICGGVFAWAHEWFVWRPDERNPFRRYCRKCGQHQELYTWGDEPARNGWWENMGLVNTDCPVGHKTDDRL